MRPSSSEFACDVAIEAGAACVYDALTTAGGLSLWWGHRIEDDLRVGSAAELVLGGGCVMRIRVDELERPSRVVWTCVGGVAEWERSTLRFDLRGRDDSTLLRLTPPRLAVARPGRRGGVVELLLAPPSDPSAPARGRPDALSRGVQPVPQTAPRLGETGAGSATGRPAPVAADVAWDAPSGRGRCREVAEARIEMTDTAASMGHDPSRDIVIPVITLAIGHARRRRGACSNNAGQRQHGKDSWSSGRGCPRAPPSRHGMWPMREAMSEPLERNVGVAGNGNSGCASPVHHEGSIRRPSAARLAEANRMA